MTGQRWPNALFDKEWVISPWQMQACWAEDVGTVGNDNEPISKVT